MRKSYLNPSETQYTSEFKYNWKLAAPVMLGMLGHTFVSFIDNIMVGQLGTAELAAVSLGNSFMFIAMSMFRSMVTLWWLYVVVACFDVVYLVSWFVPMMFCCLCSLEKR